MSLRSLIYALLLIGRWDCGLTGVKLGVAPAWRRHVPDLIGACGRLGGLVSTAVVYQWPEQCGRVGTVAAPAKRMSRRRIEKAPPGT